MLEELRKGLAESESGWRMIAEIERDIARTERVGRPMTLTESAWEDAKVELKVLGHRLLLLLMIAVGYMVVGVLLIFALPYIWDWFWSVP